MIFYKKIVVKNREKMKPTDLENFLAIVRSGFNPNPLFKVPPTYSLAKLLRVIREVLRNVSRHPSAKLFGSFLRNGVAQQTFDKIEIYIPTTENVDAVINHFNYTFIRICQKERLETSEYHYQSQFADDKTTLRLVGFVEIDIHVDHQELPEVLNDFELDFPYQQFSIDRMYYNVCDLDFDSEELYSVFRMDRNRLHAFPDIMGDQTIKQIKDDIFKRKCYVLDAQENMVHCPEPFELYDREMDLLSLDDDPCIRANTPAGNQWKKAMQDMLKRGYTLIYKDANCNDSECMFHYDPPQRKASKKTDGAHVDHKGQQDQGMGATETVDTKDKGVMADQPKVYTGAFQMLEEVMC